MEWFAILIPIIAVIATYIMFPHRVAWFEIFLPIMPALFIIGFSKLGAELIMTSDNERWGAYVISSRYYEDWDEYVHQTCTRTDSKGNTTTYDCSYVDYHPPYWEVTDSNNATHYVDEDTYEYIKTRFGNSSFHDLHRHYHWNDGDMYETTYPNNKKVMINWFTVHRYENRVIAARSVFKFPEVSDTSKLYEWPQLSSHMDDPAILGDAPDIALADYKLQHYNAVRGRQKEVRVWILLYKNQPRSVGFDQESFWQGGNKNEVTICISTDDKNNVQWCHCFCWSPDGNTSNDVMKINIRDYVEKQKPLKLMDTVDYSCKQIDDLFVRKHFKEFSYLSVEMPTSTIIMCYIITLLSSVGACAFVVYNDINNDNATIGDILESMRT